MRRLSLSSRLALLFAGCTAALSLLAGRLLLRPAAHERAMLEALRAAGAVDGCTQRNELSVDGLCWENYAATITDIYEETRSALAERNADAAAFRSL